MKIKVSHRRKRDVFRLSPLFLAMASIIPVSALAGVAVDENESKRLSIAVSANGTPLININDSNASGVSHNKFSEFNVGREGVIFNNSMQDGVAKIGGYTMKNNQLTSEAKVILSEVTGANGSYLNGTMEVFGRSADLIIANENGITVNGVSTLNANNLTLSTGRVNLDQNGNVNLSVNRGDISVEGTGINTDGLSYFDIVSRSATLSGEIAGSADVKVVTGLNDYDTHSRAHSVRSRKASDTPQVAISGSHLGSMFGNKIQLISTESGAGVNHTGSVVGNNGIEITADGEIRLANLASESGRVAVAGKSVFLKKNAKAGIGGISAQQDVILTALAGMELNADVIAQNGVIRINAGSLLQSAAALLAKNNTRSSGAISAIQINVADRYQMTGSLYAVDSGGNKIANAAISVSKGQYVVKVGSRTISNVTVLADASLVSASGDITINAGTLENNQAMIAARKGNLIFNLTDSLINNGLVQANGTIALSGKILKNKGIISTTDNMKITLGGLDNSGSMYAGSLSVITDNLTNSGIVIAEDGGLSVQLTGDKQSVNSGTLQATGAISLKGNSLKNAGAINTANTIDVTLDKLDNSGDMFASAISATVVDEFDNKGTIVARSGDVSVDVLGEKASNSGILQASRSIDLRGQKFRNEGTLLASESLDIDLSNGLENSTSGTFYAKKIKVVADNLDNEGRFITAEGDLSLQLTGTSDSVNNGTLTANGSIDLQGQGLKNQGTINAAESLDVTVAGGLENSGSMYANDITVVGDELQNKGNFIARVGDLSLDAQGKLSNSGTLQASGAVELKGQEFSNQNLVNAIGGGLKIDLAEGFKNSETGKLYGNSVTVKADKLKNEGGISATKGNISLESQGAIDNLKGSSLLASGSIDLDGSNLNNQGTINTANDLKVTVNVLKNSGDMFANTISSVGDKFDNEGSIIARAGDLSVDVRKEKAFNSGTFNASGAVNLTGRGLRNESLIMAGRALDINLDEELENSASGTLYAKKIKVVADKLNNEGRIIAAAGDLSLQLEGTSDSVNSGTLTANGSIDLQGNGLKNQGIINAADNLDITVDILENSGALYGNDILFTGDDVINEGKIIADQTLQVQVDNGVDNRKGGTFQAIDSIELTGSRLSNDGNFVTSGNLNITLGEALKNSGTIHGDNITVETDELQNKGAIISRSGDLSLQVKGENETLNTGTLQAGGAITLTGESLRNEGVINSGSLLDITLDNTLKNSGDMYAGNSRVMTKDLQNQGNIIVEKGNITLESQGDNDVVNSGTIKSKSADITAGGTLINEGIIGVVDELNVDVESLNNKGKVYSQGNMTLALKEALNNSGEGTVISATNGLKLTGETKNTLVIKNTDGAVIQSAAGDIKIEDVKSLQNTNAAIITKKDLTISGSDTVVNDNGVLQGENVVLRNVIKLNNSGENAKIIANSSLLVRNIDELKNEHGDISSYGDAQFENINSILNKHGKILAAENIEIDTVNLLKNSDKSIISSSYGSILFDAIQSVQNMSSSVIQALKKVSTSDANDTGRKNSDSTSKNNIDGITFNQVTTLENAGTILSNLSIVLSGLDSFVNNGQYAYVQGLDIIVSKVDSFINKDYAGILARNNLKLTDINDLKNILSLSDINDVLEDAATFIQASRIEMDVGELTNSGYLSQIIGSNSNSIVAGDIVNTGQGGIYSDGSLSLTADTVNNEESSAIDAANYLIDVNSLVNKGAISSVSSAGRSLISADKVDNSEGIISNADYLTIKTDDLDNSDAGYIWGRSGLNLELTGDFNNNDYNTIGSNTALSITTTGDVTIDKKIESYGSVNIDAKSVTNNKAIVSAQDIYLIAENVINNSNSLIFAMNNLIVTATGTILNKVNGNILSQNSITLSADTIHNQAGVIRSEGNMWLDANLIHNESTYKGVEWDFSTSETGSGVYNEGNNSTWGKKHSVSIIIPGLASDISLDTRAEISAGGNMMINQEAASPGVVNNEGGLIQTSGSIYVRGDLYNAPKYVAITMEDYLNTELSEAITFGFYHFDFMWSDSNSHKFTTLYQMFDYLFGGTSGARNKDTEDSGKYVSALKITANEHFLLNSLMKRLFGETWSSSSFDSLQEQWNALNTKQKKMIPGESVWSEELQDFIGAKSTFVNIDEPIKSMKTYFLPSEKASIIAGQNFIHSDGGFNNGLADELNQGVEANRVVEVEVAGETIHTLEQNYEVKFNKKNLSELVAGVGTLSTVSNLLNIDSLFDKSQAFIEYTLSETQKDSGSGSSPEGDVNSQTDFRSSAPAPESADAPAQAGEAAAASELEYVAGQSQISGSSASTASVSTAQKGAYTIVPMYETRIEMIDQDKFYGSQYFFDSVGYESEKPVVVVGDNYFITELIRRQINESVGTYFSVKYGIDGADLVQMLFDNAGQAMSGLTLTAEGAALATNELFVGGKAGTKQADQSVAPLVVGQALTTEQIAALQQDIVWFVTESIDGVAVLVPRIYLASSTIKEIEVANETGAAIVYAGENVVVDADSVNNVNAVIGAGNHVVLTAKNDINLISSGMNSGIEAGGTVALTSNSGDIISSGSMVKAGENIILSAEQGSIDFIASVGRDDVGNQLIGAYEDGLSAGGTIQMAAQDFDFTAISLTAGDAVAINATKGSVNFNDIHQVTASYDRTHEDTGFMAYREEETVTTDARSKTSSVNADGAFVINAAEDVVFKGGNYEGSDLSIVAGGDVTIETSQDISHKETKVTESGLTFGYRYQVPGMDGQGSESTMGSVDDSSAALASTDPESERAFSMVDTAESGYISTNPDSNLSGTRAKKPGAAVTSPSGSFEAGLKTTETVTTETSITNTNASFNFTNGAYIEAGKTLDIGGLDLSVGDDATAALTGNDIISTKYNDVHKATKEVTTTFIGVQGEGHSALADIASKNIDLIKQADDGKEIDAGLTAASAAGDLTNIALNDWVGGSTTLGWSSTTEKSESTTTSENINHISGGTIDLTSKRDTTLKGVVINASNVNGDVGGDFSISAAESTYTASSGSVKEGAGLSYSAGAAPTGAGLGAGYSYSRSESQTDINGTSYTNSEINAANVNLTVKGDMTMEGANINADRADLDMGGDLTITSVQDTYSENGSGYNVGASVGIAVSTNGGLIPTGEVNGGKSESYYDSKLTGQQSGIHTSGEVNARVGGDANLAGAHIVSDSQTGAVNVAGNINVTDVYDSVDSGGFDAGGGGGVSAKGTVTVNGYYNTEDEINYQETNKSTINADIKNGTVNGDLNTDADNMSEVTEDSVKAGNDISFTFGGTFKESKKKNTGSDTTSTNNNSSSNGNNNNGSGTTETDGSGSGTQQPGTSDAAAKPQTPSVTDNTGTAKQNPGTSDAAKPQTPSVTDNTGTAKQNSGTSDAAKPQTSSVTGDTVTSETIPAGGKKWPTVQPSKPYIGGTGSASRPASGNYAGHTKPAGNSPASNDGVKKSESKATEGGNVSDAAGGKKWPTVKPADGYIGGSGSATRPGSGNYAGSAIPASNSPSRLQKTADNSGSSTVTDSVDSVSTAKDYSGKKWPTVQPAKPIVGGSGSATRPGGSMAAGSTVPANSSPKQNAVSTGHMDTEKK